MTKRDRASRKMAGLEMSDFPPWRTTKPCGEDSSEHTKLCLICRVVGMMILD